MFSRFKNVSANALSWSKGEFLILPWQSWIAEQEKQQAVLFLNLYPANVWFVRYLIFER